ncbi:hypothetical protein C8F04DRAFT_1288164 [Mycena alexandri]|uniref:Uncharacterized protein n=1 Tax=Mycena alexandri TaxID=1745969 RepID=A0AAD6X295_9AGAR|nr:hypothetical protein C8F04DRAFT_1288164 [Mycena alexandri]
MLAFFRTVCDARALFLPPYMGMVPLFLGKRALLQIRADTSLALYLCNCVRAGYYFFLGRAVRYFLARLQPRSIRPSAVLVLPTLLSCFQNVCIFSLTTDLSSHLPLLLDAPDDGNHRPRALSSAAPFLPPTLALQAASLRRRARPACYPCTITTCSAYLATPANGYVHAGLPQRFVQLVGMLR